MSSNDVKVILYYAEWCGHCQRFKPEWAKLKDELEKKGMKWAEYESEKDGQKMEEENIEGFPTIIILMNGKKNEYNGQRTSSDIMNFINGNNDQSQDNKFKQCGGKRQKKTPRKGIVMNSVDPDINYKIKYLKYKGKYMKKKAEMDV